MGMTRKHLNAARAHRTVAAIYGVRFVLLAVFFYLTIPSDRVLFGISIVFVSCVLLVGMHLAIARGADECKGWARVASIILGVLLLPGFPVFTALGAWLHYNSVNPWEQAPRGGA